MNQLKPCPFCGHDAEVRRNRQSPTFDIWVECTNRACQARTASDDSTVGAISLWNARSEQRELMPV